MTVAELINELMRMPAHHVVLVEFPDRSEMKPFGFAPEIGSIAAVDQECTHVVLHVPGVLNEQSRKRNFERAHEARRTHNGSHCDGRSRAAGRLLWELGHWGGVRRAPALERAKQRRLPVGQGRTFRPAIDLSNPAVAHILSWGVGSMNVLTTVNYRC